MAAFASAARGFAGPLYRAKIEAATVDMPLRLDNANALTTYRQPKRKKQEAD
jgi:hypothetical protein